MFTTHVSERNEFLFAGYDLFYIIWLKRLLQTDHLKKIEKSFWSAYDFVTEIVWGLYWSLFSDKNSQNINKPL